MDSESKSKGIELNIYQSEDDNSYLLSHDMYSNIVNQKLMSINSIKQLSLSCFQNI